jgi:hypothetical protein
MLAPPHRRVLRVLPEPTREDYQQISIWLRFLPMKKLYLARIVFGTMLAVLEVKCRSSGTFMPLPVCLFTIVFCYVICNTMLVSSMLIRPLQLCHLVVLQFSNFQSQASLNSAGFCACYAHLSHLLALPVLFDR